MEKTRVGIILTTDAVITDGLRVALIRRIKPPFENSLVLPGGHVEEGETLVESCRREMREEVDLETAVSNFKLLTILDGYKRDPRPGRRVSVVFLVRVARNELDALSAGSDAVEIVLRDLFKITESEIGFDHWQAIRLLKEGGRS